MFKFACATLALAALPQALGASIQVQVGASGILAFNPPFVNANPGDVINFVFNPKNHAVTQSSFSSPCVGTDEGFTTGFVPVASGTQTKSYIVPKTSEPLWFHCGQIGHCASGMVFAINPPDDPAPNSFSVFKDIAMGKVAPPSITATSPSSSPATSHSATAASSSHTPITSPTSVTPPSSQGQTVTATVTLGGSTYTTTYSIYNGTPSPTPTIASVDHKIIVGENGNLSYDPPNISAAIGDTVTFEFHSTNHTVTQSSFLNPCLPLQETTGVAGFNSGLMFFASDTTLFPTFPIRVNDTSPIWGYCGQANHCSSGMVFAINAIESGPNNFTAFQQMAIRTAPSSSTSAGGSSSTADSSTGFAPKPTSGAIANPVSIGLLSAVSVSALLCSLF